MIACFFSVFRKTSTFTKSPSLAFFPEHDFRKPSTFTKSPSLAVYPQQGQLEEVTLFDRPVRRVGDEYLFGSEYETKPQPRSAGPSSITVPSTNCKITVTTGDITKQKVFFKLNSFFHKPVFVGSYLQLFYFMQRWKCYHLL